MAAPAAGGGGAAPAPEVVAGPPAASAPAVALAAAQAQARQAEAALAAEVEYADANDGARPPDGWHTARWALGQADLAVSSAEDGLEFARDHAAGIVAGAEEALANAQAQQAQARADLERLEAGDG
jgi:hypothetical protein